MASTMNSLRRAALAASRTVSRASRPQVARLHIARPNRTSLPSCMIRQQYLAPILQRRWLQDDAELKPSTIYDFNKVKQLALSSPSSPNRPLLIDVREPHEFTAGHIPTAINIPIQSQPDALFLGEEEFEDRFGFRKPDVEKEVVFYCKAGVRSKAAAQFAGRNGYMKVGEYPGSWVDWVKQGGEVGGNGAR